MFSWPQMPVSYDWETSSISVSSGIETVLSVLQYGQPTVTDVMVFGTPRHNMKISIVGEPHTAAVRTAKPVRMQGHRMRETRFTDEALEDHPAADIDVVVADPDDVVGAFERNAGEESRLNTHVLRLVPPFEGEVVAEPYLQEGPKRYPPDADPEPIHLPPATFVENDDGPHPGETHLTVPTLADARSAAREAGGDVDAATVESHHERLLAEWEADVRDSLLERIRIVFEPGNADEIWVDARYERR